MRTLETRVSPKKTAKENQVRIKRVDAFTRFGAMPYDRYPRTMEEFLERGKPQRMEKFPHFFVFHFIKKKDPPGNRSILDRSCRHHNLRRSVRAQAIAMAQALSRSPEFCCRVRGIDSASNEIGCPPEVFASAYRFLRSFRPADFERARFFGRPPLPRLSATYHAGEDFLDIAGALRSIDEAVNLLELSRGDRLGHALGLGVDPEKYYKLKSHKVFMSRQDRLDDLVWLMYRAREIGVQIDPHLFGTLKREAETLLLDIYSADNHEQTPSLTEYYHSMRLRADDPEWYRGGEYRQPKWFLHPYEESSISQNPELDPYRKNSQIARIYARYHFGREEKQKGSQPVQVEIESAYRYLMRHAQDQVQAELERRGIVIECNPSSNVLIGTFQRYEDHPIFRFNTIGRESDLEKRQDRGQLQVCINTDDIGVFDTSQEFEYALVFHALYECTDTRGRRLYSEDEILSYLDNLRQIGLRAVFPEAR